MTVEEIKIYNLSIGGNECRILDLSLRMTVGTLEEGNSALRTRRRCMIPRMSFFSRLRLGALCLMKIFPFILGPMNNRTLTIFLRVVVRHKW